MENNLKKKKLSEEVFPTFCRELWHAGHWNNILSIGFPIKQGIDAMSTYWNSFRQDGGAFAKLQSTSDIH